MYTSNLRQIGTNIKRELESRGIKQQKLADALGISKQVMNKIIEGRKAINLTEFAKIANALGIATDALLTDEPYTTPVVSLSYMERTKRDEEHDKVSFIRCAIDDIYFLEELLHN